jgi:uncharacterized membrane protein YbhN (UPF0104 family)
VEAEELSPRHLRRRLLEVAAVAGAVAVVVVLGPGLGSVRSDLARASPWWLAAGVALEVLSTLSYIVIFRAVFCPRMSWRLSYQFGMAEQGANSVLSVSGAGGLALGAWALRRSGVTAEYIGRRTVAFFFLTSMANVVGVIVFAALYALGVLDHDRDTALTYAFGAAAIVATAFVLALPAVLRGAPTAPRPVVPRRRLRSATDFVETSVGQGIRDARSLLRQRPIPVLVGALGTVAFDLAVLGAAFGAMGAAPALGVLVLGYLIGQLGGNLPVPGGIGGLDAGLIGVLVLYKEPVAAAAAAVLVYRAISLWIPALLGSAAFLRLRRTLERREEAEAVCMPLTEPIEVVCAPALTR